MSLSIPIASIAVPAFHSTFNGVNTEDPPVEFTAVSLTTAVTAIRDALAAVPRARDTNAGKQLSDLIETLRHLGL